MHKQNGSSLFYLLITLIVVLTIGFAVTTYYQKTNNNRKEWQTAQRELAETARHLSVDVDQTTGITKEIDTTPKAKGVPGKGERFVKTFYNDVIKNQNDYSRKLDDIGWTSVLDPNHWLIDNEFSQSRTAITQASKIVKDAKEKHFSLINSVPDRINVLNLEDKYKQEMLEGFHRGFRENQASLERIWDIEEQSVDVVSQIVEFMRSRNGRWLFEDDQIRFETDDEADEYNALMKRFFSLQEEQQAIRNKMAEERMKFFTR